ncbi:hypothetical protein [Thalassotalea euphylliae]|uniref:Uncharacterized protein n=1 Tax=Thalassotalea euphylliae TaxID=1655234 RepID=A0A3E0TZ91_9GAMM|nr:hypothetical protein [Thalassotalea euphylliae]REL29693.1 hypothetical protein DXX94_02620 [Thalassotalea euphylliae]
MESLRELLAVLCFVAGCFLSASLVTAEFSWSLLFVSFVLFVSAYWCWPSKRRGKRDGDHVVLDVIELVIEFPVDFVVWFFRLVGRILGSFFGGKGDGIDIDF